MTGVLSSSDVTSCMTTTVVKCCRSNAKGRFSTNHSSKTTEPIFKQELRYRKQIARQLRTQYVEDIYDNPVTLKSRLTVTQGHWKRIH